MLSDGYSRIKSRSPRKTKNSHSFKVKRSRSPRKVKRSRSAPRKVKRNRSAPRKVKRSRSAPRKVKRSRSAPRKVKRSRSAPRKVKRSRSAPRKVKRSRSAPRKVRRSRSVHRRRLTPEEKIIRKSKIIRKALENCKNYGVNSEECLRTMRVISKPARDNIREIIRKLDEQKMKILTPGPSLKNIFLKSKPIPEYWPNNKQWPLPENIKISSILETLPPIFVLSNGERIKGVLRKPSMDQQRFKNVKCKLIETWITNTKEEYNGIIPKDIYYKFIHEENSKRVGLTPLEIKQCMNFYNETISDITSNTITSISKIVKNTPEIIKKMDLNQSDSNIATPILSSILQTFNYDQVDKIQKNTDVDTILKDNKEKIMKLIQCTKEQILNKVEDAFPNKVLTTETLRTYYEILKESLKDVCDIQLTLPVLKELLVDNKIEVVENDEELSKKLQSNQNLNDETIKSELTFSFLEPCDKYFYLKEFKDKDDNVIDNAVDNKADVDFVKNLSKSKASTGSTWKKILGVAGTFLLLGSAFLPPPIDLSTCPNYLYRPELINAPYVDVQNNNTNLVNQTYGDVGLPSMLNYIVIV